MADRPNFFELLGLDPERDADWKVIEERIEAKKRDWARDGQSSPKKRQEAKRNMDLLPEIRRVLEDPALRRQEAEAARRLHREARKTRDNELAGWIELLRASGRCRPEKFEKICRQFAGAFSEAEIRQRLAEAGVRVVEPRSWERTDPSIARDIRLQLELLKLASLYAFVGLPPASPASDLRARAEEIYKENLNLGRTDATASAQNKLFGLAQPVFSSEEEKRKYDNELILSAFESLDDEILFAGDDKVLSAQKIQFLIRRAVERGIPETDAFDLLEERATQEGWRFEPAPSGPAPSPAPSPAGSPGPSAGPEPSGTEDAEPPAPSRLIVRSIPGGLRLSWEPVGLEGIRYRVLRKADSMPRDEGDGDLVVQTRETQVDDVAVPYSVPLHYAVFSLRNGLASRVPARSGPHLIVAPGSAGAPRTSRNLGGLPVRGIAAGLTLLTLGGGTAFFMGLPPFAASPQAAQTAPTPISTSGTSQTSGTASGGSNTAQTAQSGTPSGTTPPSGSQTTQLNAGITSTSLVPIQPSPNQDQGVPNSGGLTGNSGGNSPSNSVQGDSASQMTSRPAPPQLSAPLPANPEVAVIAVGDPLLASSLEDELESAFRDAGIDVVSGSRSLEDLRRHRSGSPSVSDILTSLRGDGVHAVVIAQVDRLADRELQYYGRKDVVSTSRVRIHAYLVDGNKSLGSGWSEQIEYNAVNAPSEGESAARRAAPDLADAVRNAWGSIR
jgi:hypothetical protein